MIKFTPTEKPSLRDRLTTMRTTLKYALAYTPMGPYESLHRLEKVRANLLFVAFPTVVIGAIVALTAAGIGVAWPDADRSLFWIAWYILFTAWAVMFSVRLALGWVQRFTENKIKYELQRAKYMAVPTSAPPIPTLPKGLKPDPLRTFPGYFTSPEEVRKFREMFEMEKLKTAVPASWRHKNDHDERFVDPDCPRCKQFINEVLNG